MSNQIHELVTPNLPSLQNKIEANWEKHRVTILTGVAIAAGGVAMALTGGLAAAAALAIALIASGCFAATGGSLLAAWNLLKDKEVEVAPILLDAPATPPRSPVRDDEASPRMTKEELLGSDGTSLLFRSNGKPEAPSDLPKLDATHTLNVAEFCANTTRWTDPNAFSNLLENKPVAETPQAVEPAPFGSLVSQFTPYDAFPEKPRTQSSESLKKQPSTPSQIEEDKPVAEKQQAAEPESLGSPVRSFVPDSLLHPKTQTTQDEDGEAEFIFLSDPVDHPYPIVLREEQNPPPYLPSARKAAGLLIAAAGAIGIGSIGIGYGLYTWATLTPQEREEYLKCLSSGANQVLGGAEALFRKGGAALNSMASTVDFFPPTSNETLMQMGTKTFVDPSDPITSSDITLLRSGTAAYNGTIPPFLGSGDPINSCTASSSFPDARRGYVEYYGPRLATLATQTASSVASFLWNIPSFASGFVPSQESVTEMLPGLPSTRLALAVGAPLAIIRLRGYSALELVPAQEETKNKPKVVAVVELKNDEIPDELLLLPKEEAPVAQKKPAQTASFVNSLIPSARKTKAVVGVAMAGTLIALGIYRFAMSTEQQQAVVEWINSSSWRNTFENWTQKAVNADPMGALTSGVGQSTVGQAVGTFVGNVQTCASAAAEYATAGDVGQIQTRADAMERCPFTASSPERTFEELGVPFVDLSKVVHPFFDESGVGQIASGTVPPLPFRG